MGCVQSREQRRQKYKSDEIDRALKQSKPNEVIKLLLLGAGESGKSTLLKQMRILHADGYTKEERLRYKPVICSNTLQSIYTLAQGMRNLGFQLYHTELWSVVRDIEELLEAGRDTLPLHPSLAVAISNLWRDPGIRNAYKNASAIQLNDSAAYFLDSVTRISKMDYIPTIDDILRARVHTTGIIETRFTLRGFPFLVVDVGGQRSERKKWIHCFSDVTTLIFCAALSDYDLALFECKSVNRMRESLNLFGSVANNSWFINTPIILFLNKTDLLLQKLPRSPLHLTFPDYFGPPEDVNSAMHFIRLQYERLAKGHRDLFTHFCCATDTNNVMHVMNDVTSVIIERNLNNFQCL